MGFADLAALMEFHANNPTAPNKPVAVMMVYNNTPAAVFALKKSGIQAGRPGRQEAGRTGVRRRPQGLADLRQGQRHRQRHLGRHGPAAARNHAGAWRRRRHHRLFLHQPAEPGGPRREGRGDRRAALPGSTG
jgi:hypothetical protein